MSVFPHFLRSLLVTLLLSFTTPVILVGGTLAILSTVSCIPGFAIVGRTGAEQLLDFLAVFGNGCALEGVITIGLTCSVVGGLFDLFNSYRYQNLRGQR